MTADIDWSRWKVWTAPKIKAAVREREMAEWGKQIEIETRNRIRLAIAAYAYEVRNTSIMTDHEFDRLAQSIRPRMGTCHPLLDEFFITRFSPMTGMWIHHHPELRRIAELFQEHHA